jgi:HSP20 family protein|tara:strand:+ start:1220 stop:1666 length:447 start_codon:yes stop_codon:yes gene_type:complete
MSLVKYRPTRYVEPFRNLFNLEDDIERLFGPSRGDVARVAWNPALDLQEEKDTYVVKAELPGLEKDHVSITMDADVLTLKGEKKQDKAAEDNNVYRNERYYGAFQRSIRFASEVKADKITAEFKNGVLTITLPKSEAVKPKEIPVTVA